MIRGTLANGRTELRDSRRYQQVGATMYYQPNCRILTLTTRRNGSLISAIVGPYQPQFEPLRTAPAPQSRTVSSTPQPTEQVFTLTIPDDRVNGIQTEGGNYHYYWRPNASRPEDRVSRPSRHISAALLRSLTSGPHPDLVSELRRLPTPG